MRRQHGGGTRHSSKGDQSLLSDTFSLFRAFDSETNPTRPLRPSPLSASTTYGLPLDLLDRIRSFPLFQSAPESFLAAIGTHLRPQLHSPRDYIVTEGDDAKAMFWLVRGAVTVTSRDGESIYAELKPGAFFGEIGIMMDMPRTATIIAKMKCLLVKLNKEDLQKELPKFPEVERAIREEAKERLTILERRKKENHRGFAIQQQAAAGSGKRSRDVMYGDVEIGDTGHLGNGRSVSDHKRRKSPSPGLTDVVASSALGSGRINVRQLLRELPLFSKLPPNSLHFLGLNAEPRTFPPFTDIIRQGSQGREIFFVVSGEVEVVTESTQPGRAKQAKEARIVKARLRAGQYFGEVVSLSLAPLRTATVRSVTSVECLMIGGDVLQRLWDMCSPDLRHQVELTARQRLKQAVHLDFVMIDPTDGIPAIDVLAIAERASPTSSYADLPTITLDGIVDPVCTPSSLEDGRIESADPDPFLSLNSDNVRLKSRRSSLAPPSVDKTVSQILSPLSPGKYKLQSGTPVRLTRPQRIKRRQGHLGKGLLPDVLLVRILQHLDIYQLLRLRQVSMHWSRLLSTSPDLMHFLDLSKYNRRVTDAALTKIICPFVGARPRVVDLSNCFHVTDEGFNALIASCGPSITGLRMKSVWDVSPQAVLELANKCKVLEEVDLSNCRKVSDNLLARVLGWIVPERECESGQQAHLQDGTVPKSSKNPAIPGPGTVIGCPSLKKLKLSYCKHVSDRSMAHIAVHAAQRVEHLDLTRCTSITDVGFQHWSVYPFPRLQKLCLADCTYLSDTAVVCLTNAAKGLKELDLSFCCALSDTAVEVLALGCPNLMHLNLAFCGSAVSDGSLRSVGLHLLDLRVLSVRGCVRVTGAGVEAVLDGCRELKILDISQCKSLTRWLGEGGIERKGKSVNFVSVPLGLG